MFYKRFFILKMSKSLILSFLVARQKWANEWIARFFEQIAHLLIFGQKTSESLRNL